jgi:aerobic carbon-monoxide dehydrogenase large subunit
MSDRQAHVGRSTLRIEDERLVTGRARWVENLRAEGALYLGVVRSPIAHAHLERVDVAAAREVPGVVAAYSATDLADTWHAPLPGGTVGDGPVPEHWPLATDRVRHVGDPVAVVVAESAAAAADGAEYVDVDYAPLPALPDVGAALDADTLIHDGFDGNVAFRYEGEPRGDVDAAFAEADVVIERRYVQPRLVATSLEPRSALAVPDPAGGLVLYTSTQVPHRIREHVAACLGLDEREVRVAAFDVGGGFGAKLNPYPEDLLCAALALRLSRPVRWTATRSEEMQTTNHGRGQVQHIAVAARSDGTLLGLQADITADCGAYLLLFTAGVPMSGRRMLPGCYRWRAFRFSATGVFTNATPTDAYRGAGRPEATFAVERAIEDLAAELGMDPAEVRRRNMPTPEEFPFTNVAGLEYDSGDYRAALDRVLETVEYDGVRAEQRDRRHDDERVQVGIGLSSYVEICGFGPGTPESGGLRVRADGQVEVLTGLGPTGQGTATTLAQLAADELGVEPSEITVIHGDTALVPVGAGTFGSRSMSVGGPAVRVAATEVADKARRIAAHLLEAAVEDVEVGDGRLSVRGSPDAAVSLAEVARAAATGNVPEGMTPGLEASTHYQPEGLTIPFGVHACVVEVDTETGKVSIRRFVAVDDVGTVLNPALLDGQRQGGIAQGIAQALYEAAEYDEDGNLQTASLIDYLVPGAPDLPDYELDRTVTPSPHNPLGVKGAGEAGAIGAPPAVVNAVVDALRHLGIEDVEMPCTPERVWRAVEGSRRGPEATST